MYQSPLLFDSKSADVIHGVADTFAFVWQHTVPKPCTAEDLDKIQTWLDSKEVLTKDEVMLETFGYTDEKAANRAVSFQGPACIGCIVVR